MLLNPSLQRQLFLFIFIRFLFGTSVRMIYPFLPEFSRGLGVDLATISSALSLSLATSAVGVFIATIADRRGRKGVMTAGVLFFILGSSLLVIWPAYLPFLAGYLLANLGQNIFMPALLAYLGDHVPYLKRGFVIALIEISWALSFIIGIPLIGFAIAGLGWQSPFYLLSACGIVVLLLVIWLVPPDQPAVSDGSSFWHSLKQVLSYAPALAGLVMGLAIGNANQTVSLVFGAWMEDAFGLQVVAIGTAAAVIGFSELGGEALSGSLVDRLGKERSLAIGLGSNILFVLIFPWLGTTLSGALVWLFLYYLSLEFAIVCTLPLMSEVMPSTRATLIAAYTAALSLGLAFGARMAPVYYAHGFQANALASAASLLVALLAMTRIKVHPTPQSLQ